MSTDGPTTVNGQRVIVLGGGANTFNPPAGVNRGVIPIRNHSLDPRRINPLAQPINYNKKPSTEVQIQIESAAEAKRKRRAVKSIALAAKKGK